MDARHLQVRDVMVEEVQSVAPEDTLRDAMEVMMEQGLTTLPVVDPTQHCIGVIAAVDLLAPTDEMEEELRRVTAASGEEHGYLAEVVPLRGLAAHSVEDFMSANVITVAPETPLPIAAGLMLQHQVHHLIVVDHEDHIIGILSTMDILETIAAPVEAARASETL